MESRNTTTETEIQRLTTTFDTTFDQAISDLEDYALELKAKYNLTDQEMSDVFKIVADNPIWRQPK